MPFISKLGIYDFHKVVVVQILRYNKSLKQICFAKIVDKLNYYYNLSEARELKIIKLKEEIHKLKKENHILKGKNKQQTKELAYLYEKYDVW